MVFIRCIALFVLLVSTSQAADFPDKASLMKKLDQQGEVGIIITFKSDTTQAVIRSQLLSDGLRKNVVASLQSHLLGALNANDYKALHRFEFVPQLSMKANSKALEVLRNLPDIQIVENKFRRASLLQSIPRVFSNQITSNYTGANQWAVAVLDTGVDKYHGFLKTGNARKVISEACYSGAGGIYYNAFSLCPGGAYSTTVSGSGRPCTMAGCDHGTHVAGIAAGDGASFDGTARLGKIIAIQVFSRVNDFSLCYPYTSCALVADSDLIKGLERVYALRNTYKIAAANVSIGGGAFSGSCNGEPHKPIIDALRAAKIATVVATGNEESSTTISSPACISSAIAVGSTLDSADVRSYFSNNSPMLDLYAPGSNITSSVPGGGFAEYDGTSMATPHVAGAWAVMRHALPNATVNQIETAFKNTGPLVSYGGVSRRRIDIRAALKYLGINEGVIITPILQLLLN